MTTNQTQIISLVDTPDPVTGVASVIDTAVNSFIDSGIASGFINFDVKNVVVTQEYIAGTPPTPTGNNYYTVQINYYDPAIMG